MLETEGVEVALIDTQVERRLQSIAEAWEAARDLESRIPLCSIGLKHWLLLKRRRNERSRRSRPR